MKKTRDIIFHRNKLNQMKLMWWTKLFEVKIQVAVQCIWRNQQLNRLADTQMQMIDGQKLSTDCKFTGKLSKVNTKSDSSQLTLSLMLVFS